MHKRAHDQMVDFTTCAGGPGEHRLNSDELDRNQSKLGPNRLEFGRNDDNVGFGPNLAEPEPTSADLRPKGGEVCRLMLSAEKDYCATWRTKPLGFGRLWSASRLWLQEPTPVHN